MSPVAPRIVNDVSYVSRINHESLFGWQAQYLVTLEGESCDLRIVNDVSYVRRINNASQFAWQVQYWVTLEGESWPSAHGK